MKITKILLLTDKNATDTVYLYTDLDSPFPNAQPKMPTTLCVQVMPGFGPEWCKKCFGKEPDEVVERL